MDRIDNDLLAKVLNVALSRGGDYAEVFAEHSVTRVFDYEQGSLRRPLAGNTVGAAITLRSGDRSVSAITHDRSEEAFLQAARTVAGTIETCKAGNHKVELRSGDIRAMPVVEVPFGEWEAVKKAGRLADADKAARSEGSEVMQVRVMYRDQSRRIQIANSLGAVVDDARDYLYFIVQAYAVKAGELQVGIGTYGMQRGLEVLKGDLPEKLGRKAGRQAITNLHARPAPMGPMTIVLSAGWAGVLFHEACGHGLEADTVLSDSSVYKGKIGEQVASPLITAIDDPTIPGQWGSYGYDDEGTRSQRTVLIENGILRGYMHSLATARESGVAAGGNGRRESYEYTPIPRMSNTFIEPGEQAPEDIISATDYGLYVKDMRGGQVNSASGDFVFVVAEGNIIRKGKLEEPVRGATLIGNGPQALKRVDMVGSDFGFGPGMCGKMEQSVQAACGQPTLRVTELTVGGTEQGGNGS